MLRKLLRGFVPMRLTSKVMTILLIFRPMARYLQKNQMTKF
jgi:hypothetical protein